MKHRLVMTFSLEEFNKEITSFLHNSYFQVAGSIYIKSVETNKLYQEENMVVEDVEHIYSISLENNNSTKTVAVADTEVNFIIGVKQLLKDNNKVVIGSMYINSTRLDGYIITPRCYKTIYCCVMQKD